MGKRWPAPQRIHHQKFVETEGWEYRGTVKRRTGDHRRYQLHLPDGRLVMSKISHPPNKETYGPGLWAAILRDQLQVSAEEFWACVDGGVLPARSRRPTPRGEDIPIGVVHQLINRVGLTDAEVRALTKEQATDRLNRFCSEQTP